MLRDTDRGVEIQVRVIPRARKTEVASVRDGAVLIRIAAPPVDGAANDALASFLADRLDVPPSAIRVLTGERSRYKRVAVSGVTAERIRVRLRLPDVNLER